MVKGQFTFTAQIEKDPETQLYVGCMPSWPGAHTRAAILDELHRNLEEVILLCLEELTEEDLVKVYDAFTEHIMFRYLLTKPSICQHFQCEFFVYKSFGVCNACA